MHFLRDPPHRARSPWDFQLDPRFVSWNPIACWLEQIASLEQR